MSEPIDYLALQKELSERKGCRSCEECVEVSYEFINPKVLDDVRNHGMRLYDWEECPWRSGYIHHCKDCRAHNDSQPLAWVADIAPASFKAWIDSHDCAFAIDAMRGLLRSDHPMYEYARRGPFAEAIDVMVENYGKGSALMKALLTGDFSEFDEPKPADDGGGFKLL
jgi:hypothetical protein